MCVMRSKPKCRPWLWESQLQDEAEQPSQPSELKTGQLYPILGFDEKKHTYQHTHHYLTDASPDPPSSPA